MNGTASDFERPTPSVERPGRSQGKACSRSVFELCPKVENVEFTNLMINAEYRKMLFKELIRNSCL